MTHHAYVAASGQILEWSNGELDQSAVKVGTSRNPKKRVQFLRGVNPDSGGYVTPCCGCQDWNLVTQTKSMSEDAALDLESRFKASFIVLDVYGRQAPPFLHTTKGAGEGDIVLLPNPPLQGSALLSLDHDVRELYISGRSGMHRAARRTPDPSDHDHVNDEERDYQSVSDLNESDQAETQAENMDRSARAHEEGNYYED